MKEELIKIAKELHKYKFRNSEKVLVPVQVMVKALEDAFKRGEDNHKHIKPDCKLCLSMWRNGRENLEEGIKKGEGDGTI